MEENWTTMGEGDGSFPITRLSILRQARMRSDGQRQEALGVLWQAYWKPLYAFARHNGRKNEAAKDLVQAFCARAIEEDLLARFEPEKGRLRAWLLHCFRDFMADEAAKELAKRRGEGAVPLPIEAVDAPDPAPDPEHAYDLAWAKGLVERAFLRWKRLLAAKREDAWKLALVQLIEVDGYSALPDLSVFAKRHFVEEAEVKEFVLHRSKVHLKQEILGEIREGAGSDPEAREELDFVLRCLAAQPHPPART